MLAVLLPLGLAFIMFGLGLGLRRRDFQRAFKRPAAFLLGLVAQVLLLPLTAFAIALGLRLSPDAAAGLMILSACPGGVTAGMATFLARGDTALSISLSAMTSLIAFVTVPLVVGFSLWYFLGEATEVGVPTGPLVGGLLLVTLVPVSLGIWLGESRRFDVKMRRAVHRAATIVFVLIVGYTFVTEWANVKEDLWLIGPACLLLNLTTMGTGLVLGAALHLSDDKRVALAMECGFQNSALGITLALTLLARPELAIPSVIYAMVMNITAFSAILWRRRSLALSAA